MVFRQVFLDFFGIAVFKMGFNRRRTHDENRYCVCLLCFGKGKMINLTENLQTKIKESVPTYNPRNKFLPGVVCTTCKRKIYRGNIIKEHPNFSSLNCKKETSQSNGAQCACNLCEIASANFAKKGSAIQLKPIIFATSKGDEVTPGRHRRRRTKKPAPEKRCRSCFNILHPGIRHQCNTTALVKNFTSLVAGSSLSLKKKEQMISSAVKNLITEKKNILGNNVNSFSQLRGKPLKIYVNQRKKTIKS